MILKALAAYYQRLAEDPAVEIAPPGFERKTIDFLIVLDADGRLVELLDAREGTGKKRKGRPAQVPKAVKRASGIAANLLWDTAPYVLGRALPDKGKDFAKQCARAGRQHEAFVKRIRETFSDCDDTGIRAVLLFLESADFSSVFAHPVWPEIEANGGNISFMLSGHPQLVCQRSVVVEAILVSQERFGTLQICSVSGEEDVPTRLHTAIKGVWGAQSSGANIVSFNLDAFRSFGKKQGHNAPVGRRTEFAYTAALNYLLSSEKQRVQIGDASTVFWAKGPCDLENDFYALIGQPKKGEESVNYERIRSLLSAVKSGILSEEADMPFYVLGLAPNASRIAVRFWHEESVGEIKQRLADHFRDIEIVRSPHDPEYLSLFQILLSTAAERKADNIPPNLGGTVMRSVLSGISYPRTLFVNAILRGKAEQGINFARAAVIKGFLARNARLSETTNKEVSMALDRTYDNIGYVLGRLFAVLERVQEQAQGGRLNKTIRDTYFGAASSSPLVAFRRLQDLAVHHLAKIRNSGKSTVWLDRLLGEVNGLLPPQGIPASLPLEDQGRFAIGYYHQRQDFFTKTETPNEGDE